MTGTAGTVAGGLRSGGASSLLWRYPVK